MPTLTAFQTLLALVAICGACDRLWGWKAGGVKGWLLAVALGAALWWLLSAPAGGMLAPAGLALAIFVWRDLPRNTFGSAIAPENNRVPETLAFNIFMLAPVFVVCVLGFGTPLTVALLLWPALAIVCTALAYLNHRLEPHGQRTGQDLNAFIEFARGAAVGAALWFAAG